MARAERPTVVVIGAGFGGLNVAKALAGAPVRTVIVDRHNYHLFTPLLYQVASALLDPGDIAQATRSILRGGKNCEFRLAEVTGADLDARAVRTTQGDIAYDHLVLAFGSEINYFGNHSIAAHAYELKDMPGAVALRNRVLDRFERARWETDDARRRALMRFAVVGGGPTGVEFCGALSELIAGPLRKDFHDLDITDARIHLIEAAGTILAPFDQRLQRSAVRVLRAKGVEVECNAQVASVDEDGITIGDGRRIEAGTVVWSAGVRAGGLADALRVPTGKAGAVIAEPTLQVMGRENVWVIGDAAAFTDPLHGALPMLAPVAIQQAKHVAVNVLAAIDGHELRHFHYRDKGIMATVGRNAGVMQIGPVRAGGFIGWLGWLAVHLVLILGFRRKLVVLFSWAWNYAFRDRPVRIILRTEPGGPDDLPRSD